MLYATDSFWTKPVPSSPKLHVNSAKMAARVANEQAKGINPFSIHAGPRFDTSSYEHPIFYATADDPIRTYHLPSFDGGGWKPPIQGYKAHVPQAAKPAKGTDSHLCVVQPDGTICDSYQTDLSVAGEVRAGWADFGYPSGMGTCTAGQFALFAGIVTPEELLTATGDPSQPIRHALFVVTAYHNGYVAPTTRDVQPNQRQLRDPSVMAFGQHGYLDMTDAELKTKPVHVRPLLRAMRDYGIYVGDTGGNLSGGQDNGGFKVDSASTSKWTCAGAYGSAPETTAGNYKWDLRPHADWARQFKVLA